MEALTGAGLLGMSTSRSALLPPLLSMTYKGHVMYGPNKATMRDYVPGGPGARFTLPTVLLVGTSMSAGKTATARVVVRLLERASRWSGRS